MLIGICVVRNEGDIVDQVLHHAASQHDLVLVADNDSTDGTQSAITDACRAHRHVVDIGPLPVPMRVEKTRRQVWARFRSAVPPGTWWSFVDGDEFVDESLRDAVSQAEDEGADHIQGAFATFAYTQSDARAWAEGREGLEDRERPIEERRRWYRFVAYSIRAFRNHPRLRWNEDTAAPRGLIRPLSRRICYRHYQHRDLEQLRLRLRSRQELDTPERHREMHYHWHYSVEEALHTDDDPDLRWHEPGDEIPIPEEWRTPWVRGPLWRMWARLRRAWRARRPQAPPAILDDVDVDEVLSLARGG